MLTGAAETKVEHEPSNALTSEINCYEKRKINLPDLTWENDKNNPQENQQFFERKSNYVHEGQVQIVEDAAN